MRLRAPEPSDAEDILKIVRAHNLPMEWEWPQGKHGLVADDDEGKMPRVVAFTILSESIYGLVIEELWEEQTREGFHGLWLLSREIETIAQRLADERGVPLAAGGIVRHELPRHIAALQKRGYEPVATVLQKMFYPQTGVHGIGESDELFTPAEASG